MGGRRDAADRFVLSISIVTPKGDCSEMMVYFSIMPIGESSHIGDSVAKALKLVHQSGIEYKLTPMGTLLKGDWDEVMSVIKKCHDAVLQDNDRVVTQIKIDDVKNKNISFDDKIKSVENKAGMTLNK